MIIDKGRIKNGLALFSRGGGIIFLKFSLNILLVFSSIYVFLLSKINYYEKISIELFILFLIFVINRKLTILFFKKTELKIKPEFLFLFSLKRTIKKIDKTFYLAEFFLILFISIVFLIFTLPVLLFYANIFVLKVVIFSSFVVSATFVFSIFPYVYLTYLGENQSEK